MTAAWVPFAIGLLILPAWLGYSELRWRLGRWLRMEVAA